MDFLGRIDIKKLVMCRTGFRSLVKLQKIVKGV